jgi:glycosyltransferase involved in cell wall biosynthesis
MTASDVSVVMATYNGALFVREALASIAAQTLQPSEVIVVDDASTDDTREIVTAWQSRSAVPVRLIRLEANSGGPARPLNRGIAAATGRYVAVLDQDDVFLPIKLAEQARALDEHPDCGLVFALCAEHDRPDALWQHEAVLAALGASPPPPAGAARVLAGRLVLAELLLRGNFVTGYPGFMFRRQALAAGGLDESLRIASDYDFLCRLSARQDVVFIPAVHYLRRVHQGNLCRSVGAMRREVSRVRARFLASEPRLRADPRLRSLTYERLVGPLGLPSAPELGQALQAVPRSVAARVLPSAVYNFARTVYRRVRGTPNEA